MQCYWRHVPCREGGGGAVVCSAIGVTCPVELLESVGPNFFFIMILKKKILFFQVCFHLLGTTMSVR